MILWKYTFDAHQRGWKKEKRASDVLGISKMNAQKIMRKTKMHKKNKGKRETKTDTNRKEKAREKG